MNPTRYFQGPTGVVSRGVPRPGSDHDFTEVQVVPLDAIVIAREELPEVTAGEVRGVRGQGFKVKSLELRTFWGDEDHRRIALGHLAVDEYRREHPPVDEAQVDAIAKVLREAQQNRPFPQQLSDRELREEARLLFQQGVRMGGESNE